MKDSPSEISAVPGLFKITRWVSGSMKSVLLPCCSSCTRSEAELSRQTTSDRDGTVLINWSAVGASIATNISK